jgi:GNAT superfamily N-acetyltransferase
MDKRQAEVTFKLMAEGDEEEASALIHRSFRKRPVPTYTDEGLGEFSENTTPEALACRRSRRRAVIVALVGNGIVGMIAVRDKNHISLLFVDESVHRRGTAARLVSMAAAEADEAGVYAPGTDSGAVVVIR